MGIVALDRQLSFVHIGQKGFVLLAHTRHAIQKNRFPIGQMRHDLAQGKPIRVRPEIPDRVVRGKGAQEALQNIGRPFQTRHNVLTCCRR
jgi:hypothetical protein